MPSLVQGVSFRFPTSGENTAGTQLKIKLAIIIGCGAGLAFF